MAYAELNGIRLYYQEHGRGEPLVLIPGMGSNHSSFFRQVRAFRKECRVITFDPRSIGRSSRPAEPYAFRALADDVAGLMDHLHIERSHILGQSLGGIVAQEVAIDYPRRVHKLILVSTLAGGDAEGINPEVTATFGTAAGAAGPVVPGPERSASPGIDTRKTMSTLIALGFNRWAYRRAMQLASRWLLKQEMFDGLADQVSAIAGHTTIERLHQIRARTLVITGTGDRIIRPQASERLAAGIPGAKLVMVRDGSHGFNLEMAPRFHREVLDFLRSG